MANDPILDEARAALSRWESEISDAGPDFQTLHMMASHILKLYDTLKGPCWCPFCGEPHSVTCRADKPGEKP